MAVSKASIDFAVDLLSGLGEVSARRMFGGVGLYAGGVMFALIDDETVFLKTDAKLKADMVAEGSVAWIYTSAKEEWPQETRYWSLPDSATDDPEEAVRWARRSLAAAQAIKAAKPVRKSRKAAG
jgi:DNA transformation protein